MRKNKIIASLGVAAVLCASCVQASSYAASDMSKEQTIEVVVSRDSSFDWTGITDLTGDKQITMEVSDLKSDINCTFTGFSNSVGGWTLTAYGKTGNAMTDSSSGATIPSLPLNTDSALTAGTSNWGYQTTDNTATSPVDGKWRGISGSETNQTEIIRNAGGGGSKTYKIWYGFATSATQTAGTYQTTIHYTFATVE